MRILHKKALLALVGVLVIAYGLWQAQAFLKGPRLYLENPPDGALLEERLLKVKGEALDVSSLTLNGRAIFTDEAGKFEEEVLLHPGVNIIELRAEDKFGHEETIERMVFVK